MNLTNTVVDIFQQAGWPTSLFFFFFATLILLIKGSCRLCNWIAAQAGELIWLKLKANFEENIDNFNIKIDKISNRVDEINSQVVNSRNFQKHISKTVKSLRQDVSALKEKLKNQ